MNKWVSLTLLFVIFVTKAFADLPSFAYEEEDWSTRGRIDVAPVYICVQVVESGKTINTLHMGGGRLDATIIPCDSYGICLKPMLCTAGGQGTFYSAGCGVGHYTPLNAKWTLVPSIGVSYTHLHTYIDLPVGPFVLPNVKETFRSDNLYLGLDLSCCVTPKWQVTTVFQYLWAFTRTTLQNFPPADGRSEGTNWGLIIDYFMTDNWTATFAAGYNNSMSKEKHGIRAYGCKAGVAWIF